MQPNNYLAIVTTILAIAAAIFPILSGFGLWKISQIFVTNRQFDEYKQQKETKDKEIQKRLESIDEKLLVVLERTADRRRIRE